MKWFQGGIAEAVASSQTNKAVFFVAIFGAEDEPSKTLEEALESVEVQPVVSSTSDFVCIRLEADSEPHKSFSQLYPNSQAASIYCVTAKGIPVDIIRPPVTPAELKQRLEFALSQHRLLLATPPAVTGNTSTPVSAGPSQTQVQTARQEARQASPGPQVQPASSRSSPPKSAGKGDSPDQDNAETSPSSGGDEVSFEEKIKRAKELALARQLKKQKEEEAEQRRREIERREAGKGAAELKRWQDEQEAKRVLAEKKKDREEEKALRQRLIEQIAQDRAARNARPNSEFAEQSAPTQRPSVTSVTPTNYSGQARLSFRLPDGSSQSHVFDPDSTLGHVRQYIIENGNLPFKTFSIWVAFPRKQFTVAEYGSSLRNLGLLPSAALLILPNSGSVGSAGVASTGGLWNLIAVLLGYVVLPFTFIWSIAQRALPSPPSSSGSKSGVVPPKRPASDNRNDGRGNKSGRHEDAGQGGSQTSSAEGSSKPRDASNQSSSSRQDKGKSPTGKATDGNVHRLRTSESDSDEDKGTWNGNSTQQM